MELTNASASGYSYGTINPASNSRYLNSSTLAYELETREYYGGENETFTFRYNGDANQVWLVSTCNALVGLINGTNPAYSVVPNNGGNLIYVNDISKYGGTVNLELKRTAEDTYVLTLKAKGRYGGVETDDYILTFPETDNYKGIIVYIHVSADE